MPLQANGEMLCNNSCLFYHLYTIINTSIGPTCSLKHQVANGVALTLLVSGSLIIMQCNQPLDFSKGVHSLRMGLYVHVITVTKQSKRDESSE